MPRGGKFRRGRSILCALAALPVHPPPAMSQSTSAQIEITAQVTDYCTFDSTAFALLSTWCSLNTPMLASSSGGFSTGSANADGPANEPISRATEKQSVKLCDSLEATELENASFNAFHQNVSHHSAAPSTYFSTYNICF